VQTCCCLETSSIPNFDQPAFILRFVGKFLTGAAEEQLKGKHVKSFIGARQFLCYLSIFLYFFRSFFLSFIPLLCLYSIFLHTLFSQLFISLFVLFSYLITYPINFQFLWLMFFLTFTSFISLFFLTLFLSLIYWEHFGDILLLISNLKFIFMRILYLEHKFLIAYHFSFNPKLYFLQ